MLTNDDGEIQVVHDVGAQLAAYLGHRIDPETMPAPTPETEPQPTEAEEILHDIVSACQNEMREPYNTQMVQNQSDGYKTP